MSTATTDAMARRLNLLERRMRTINRLLVAASGIAVIWLICGASGGQRLVQSDLVVTRKLVLTDSTGAVHGYLEAENGGGSGLLLTGKGSAKASVSVDNNGTATILTQNSDGKGGMHLSSTRYGDTTLSLSDQNGKSRAWVEVHAGSPSFDLFDGHGKVRAIFGAGGFKNEHGVDEVPPESSLILFDGEEHVISRIPK